MSEVVTSATTEPVKVDPRYRIWVPQEKKNVNGDWVFTTSDGEKYVRDGVSSVMRRAVPKLKGKAARRAERIARRKK